jgi:formate dehydrogenase subunit gamma
MARVKFEVEPIMISLNRAFGRLPGMPAALALALMLLLVAGGSALAQQQPNPNVRPPAGAVVPGGPAASDPARPGNYDVELWRRLRSGAEGKVTIPDTKAGRLVDPSGEAWRNLRASPLPTYGLYLLGGIVALLVVFFLARGRIRVEHGFSGQTIQRFSGFERTGHWLLATSFIVLALTGLNLTYGRHVIDALKPMLSPDTMEGIKVAYAGVTQAGKLLHNYVAFAFMVGLVWVFVVWLRQNIPHWRDLQWLALGGGLLVKGTHPPAWKFNAGQKILFWLVILGGISISLSGISLLFPYELPMFSKTFAFLNTFGLQLPTALTANEEMQYAATWHGIIALVLTAVIIAHIYIGTLGMEGAFSAMGSGDVDANWAKEHHSLWADEVINRQAEAPRRGGSAQPAPAE